MRFIHWLADQNATVYVKRADRKGAKDQATAIAKALEGDRPVALFPEGTTGPGTHLLPFRSTLLEAANYAARDVAIRPGRLDYGAAAARSAGGRSRARTICFGCSAARGKLAGNRPPARSARPLAATASSWPHEAQRAIAETLGFNVRRPVAYRRGANDSQDFQNQKLRLPDERL